MTDCCRQHAFDILHHEKPGLSVSYDSFKDAKQQSRSEEHTSELQSQSNIVCRLLLEKKNIHKQLDIGTLLDHKHHNQLKPRPVVVDSNHLTYADLLITDVPTDVAHHSTVTHHHQPVI